MRRRSRWGYNIRRLLETQGKTATEVAAKAGMQIQQFSDLTNNADNPETKQLQRIADGFGVDLEELFRKPFDAAHAPTPLAPRPLDRNQLRAWVLDVLTEVVAGLEGRVDTGEQTPSADSPAAVSRTPRGKPRG